MKQIAKSLVVVGAMVAAGSAAADMDMFCDFNPYVGVDYYQAWMRGKNDKNDWNRVFPKSYPGATIYIGNKFTEYFGVELGYDWSGRQKKDWTLTNGSSFFNTTASTNITGTTKIRRSGGHLDLVGFLPMNECANLFASIGYGWVQPRVSMTVNNATNTTLGSALLSVSGKGRSVFRVGVGADWMASDMFGLRAKVGWETTSTVRVKGNQNFTSLGFDQKAFKDSATIAVGAFVKF